MRSTIKMLWLLIGVTILIACNKVTPEVIDGNITDGLWYVKSYSINNYDDAEMFKGYKFDFQKDGIVSASNGTTTVEGYWSVVKGGEGHKRSQSYFTLTCPAVNHFDELCAEWHVLACGPTNLEMERQVGTDYFKLIFKKH